MSEIIKITTGDGKTLEVAREVAMMCGSIQRAAEFASSDDTIDFPNIKSAELSRIFEYCEYHNRANHSEGVNEADVKAFDANFVKMDKGLLFAVVVAANFLDIKPLLDLCCAAIANSLKGKTPEEIRREYNIENDLTPEDEEEIKAESAWLYQ
ncbi:SKP1-like protein 1A [Monocercomonoides exilis]|uniref:SKP1-like protein 1A n=1 Tax=Monocercomonoides exilis TaxID=2049356 RepID=UPI003559B27E|nr:SKP1-like protein 1A [Monocercomonoides exilis]|eukprot:MONOS_2524.1-p1 / transcript=MONOS_2524.1 / gene=MONOS_2524 / organism=Monocercomonoides_exilis_PA203 / gene_product=SKP1-like protein / transcript_product=SKP1-like protein / location=Mono_scaffold00052:131255-131855(-) / protein_length=153 / sequence_SO=supercontig / SO=protein_coding / is_pseudo=false